MVYMVYMVCICMYMYIWRIYNINDTKKISGDGSGKHWLHRIISRNHFGWIALTPRGGLPRPGLPTMHLEFASWLVAFLRLGSNIGFGCCACTMHEVVFVESKCSVVKVISNKSDSIDSLDFWLRNFLTKNYRNKNTGDAGSLQAAALEGDISLAEQWQRRLAADLEVQGGMGWIWGNWGNVNHGLINHNHNKPLVCLIGRLPFKYQIMNIGRVPP